jgi:tRNA A-37 threonylcarbamoyl transferase component Bud32
MPSAKTECTELSVGFGLLRIDPFGLTQTELDQYFDGTLTANKYKTFVHELERDEDYYRRFYALGMDLRSSYPLFAGLTTVRWEGPRHQARSLSMAKDLVASNTSISVKADSHVVFNLSPHTFFVSLPSGTPTPSRSENWYIQRSPVLYQKLYSYVRDEYYQDFPSQVADYHQTVPKKQRKEFAKTAKRLANSGPVGFKELYRSFCYDVARKSAEMFNDALANAINSPVRNSIIESIIKHLFRIGESEYILCGLNKGKDFAVAIPDLTAWKRKWKFKSLEAVPVECGQSRVDVTLTLENKAEHRLSTLKYHVEIRWAHGKFNGPPEAKVYKEFAWTDVPFFRKIYESSPVQKLACIGSGGFGTVYEGFYKRGKNKRKIAIKELRIGDLSPEERNRFEREVKTQSRLHHPNILPVIESDLSAKIPWFATPLANCNLAEIIDDFSGNYQRMDNLFRQVLQGIQYAHHHKVIHRDLKPENILLFDNEQVKISDFGLCKHLDPSELSAVLTHTSNNAMGTLPYAAPEQLESFRDADHRADIYALGKTLMHMITGQVPPITPTDLALVDVHYRSFISRCIRQNPDERFQTIDEAIRNFEEITKIQHPGQLSLPF